MIESDNRNQALGSDLAIAAFNQFLNLLPIQRSGVYPQRYPAVPADVRRAIETLVPKKGRLVGLTDFYGYAELAPV